MVGTVASVGGTGVEVGGTGVGVGVPTCTY